MRVPQFRYAHFDNLLEIYSNEQPPISSRIYKQFDSNNPTIRVGQKSGLGTAPAYNIGDAIGITDFTIQNVKEVDMLSYAIATMMTRVELSKMQEISIRTRLFADLAPYVAKAVYNAQEYSAAEPFNLGFTSYTTGSGTVLFSNSQPVAGGTYDNLASGILSPTSVAQAVGLLGNQKGLDGTPDPDMGRERILMVNPALEVEGYRIVNAMTAPNVATNDPNFFKGWQLVVNPFLTSETAWFVASKDRHYAQKYDLMDLASRMKLEEQFAGNGAEIHIAEAIWALGVFAPQGMVGSTGV